MHDPAELVLGWFSGQLKNWSGEAITVLAEDVVICPSSGLIFVAHEGYAHWHQDLRQRAGGQRLRGAGL